MKVWVIEDELPASRRLVKMLESDGETEVDKVLASVADTVTAIRNYPHPDLMVMDIHLADGSSFEIFNLRIERCGERKSFDTISSKRKYSISNY